MTTLEKIQEVQRGASEAALKMQTAAKEVFDLHIELIKEEVATLPSANVFTRSLIATLDAGVKPRDTHGMIEALKSQWPEATFDVVQDRLTGKFYIFVQ